MSEERKRRPESGRSESRRPENGRTENRRSENRRSENRRPADRDHEDRDHEDRGSGKNYRERVTVKPKKKKMPTWAKVLIIVGSVLAVLALGVFIFIKVYLARVPRIEERDPIDRSSETFDTTDEVGEDTIKASDVTWDNLYQQVMQDSDVKNILLIGNDQRAGSGSSSRSDSMILCSINKKTNKITLVSLMRDTYVPIPGFSDNRINASYAFGGAKLLRETVEQDFGISVDNAVEINFEGFIGALTQVGNLDIELNADEAAYLNRVGNDMNKEAGLGEANWNLKEGMNSLSADQALAYARTRYVGHADFERTERQRRVITAAFKKVSALGVSDQIDVVNSILPYIATDMTDSEIIGYVYYVATNGVNIGESYRIPADGTYRYETIRGMSILLPDLSDNSDRLKEWLYQGVN